MFYCPLPWCHYSIEPDGNVYTCCNASQFEPIGSVKDGIVSDIESSKTLKLIQEEILSGKIPKQCEICKLQEENGNISLRLSSLKKFGKFNKHELQFLGVRFDNTCNLKCSMCSPDLSTSLGKQNGEYRKHNAFSPEALRDLLDNNIESLNTIYVAGGEPFLSSDFLVFVEKLPSSKKKEIDLIINTNFSVPFNIIDKYYSSLKAFKSISLDISLDEVESRFEFLRKGASWNVITQNISKTRKLYPEIDLKIFITISIYNIKRLPFLLNYFVSNLNFSFNDIVLNRLYTPKHMSMENLTDDEIGDVVIEINQFLFKLKNTDVNYQSIFVQLQSFKNDLLAIRKVENRQVELCHDYQDLSKVEFYQLFPELKR